MSPLHPDIPSLLPIDSLPTLPRIIQTQVLDTLFEPTLALHDVAIPLLEASPPSSYASWIEAIRADLHRLADAAATSTPGSASPPLQATNEAVERRASQGQDEGLSAGGAVVGEAVRAQRDDANSARKTLEAILASHPRLGEKKVDSALSRLEQARMVAASSGGGGAAAAADEEAKARAAEEEAALLKALNAEYEEAFPGLRYVVFVNGRPRTVVMEDMRRRIQRADVLAERREGVDAMCDIAKDRCGKLGVA